ncbi:MAG: glycosyltransferase family 2 protein [Gemmatimonadetes bacterium]|nr:glycosyltransferase family 2 protein [Gemmatimonadota bacterium]
MPDGRRQTEDGSGRQVEGERPVGSPLEVQAPLPTESETSPADRRLPAAASDIQVSVLVPAKDEAENLPLFMEQAEAVLGRDGVRYEVIVIDDGSVDQTWATIERLRARYPFLRGVRHRSRRGIADALRTGFLNARGQVLVFYPADLQFKPEDIPRLVAPILANEADMVTGFKQGKYEKAFVSRIYNGLSRLLFDVRVKDLNSVKAYRREIMEQLPIRPDWHRYMIVIAASQGFSVAEIPVPLYPRHAGKSKFGLSRIPVGVLDMLSVWFELRFSQKPLLLFGMMGAALFATGVVAGLVALGRLAFLGVGTRSVWTVIQTTLILGSIFFVAGLLGEQVAGLRAQVRELRRVTDELHDPPT